MHQYMLSPNVSVCLGLCVCVCVRTRVREKLVISYALTLCCIKGLVTKGVFSAVGHVQKAVLVLLLVVQLAHRQTGLGDRFVDEEEDCFL